MRIFALLLVMTGISFFFTGICDAESPGAYRIAQVSTEKPVYPTPRPHIQGPNYDANGVSLPSPKGFNLTAKDVQFKQCSYQFLGLNNRVIQELVKAIKDRSDAYWILDGHMSSEMCPMSNCKLSWMRAEAMKNYLVTEYHLPAEKLITRGFGDELPSDIPSSNAANMRLWVHPTYGSQEKMDDGFKCPKPALDK